MPVNVRNTVLLVDTSVAVALTLADHEHHANTVKKVRDRALGLSGHAAYETFSVLTRLPPPARRTPATIAQLLNQSFPESRFLGPRSAAELLAELGRARIAGGAVYDALVGATAKEHRLPLATRDRRALEVYRALDVDVELFE
jgi:predicted nucleic acid-binding protein